jgi:hypothetical protein
MVHVMFQFNFFYVIGKFKDVGPTTGIFLTFFEKFVFDGLSAITMYYLFTYLLCKSLYALSHALYALSYFDKMRL